MRLIGLMFVLALSLLAPLVGEAQPAGRVYRVGILGEAASDPSETRLCGSAAGSRARTF